MIKNFAKMEEISVSNIYPKGWLLEFLKTQEEGLTGNLEVAGFPFDNIGWYKEDVNTTGENANPAWWVYEQSGYWADGLERTAELLRSRKLKNKSNRSIDYVFANQDSDGYL